MKLLLVEDDAMIGQSLVRALRDEGYAVDWVTEGVAALTVLADGAGEHALVVLDWNLPKKSGLEVLRELRAAGGVTPVLMLTARDDLGDVVKGLDAGADDYLQKPFELVELKARIRSLVRRGHGRASNVIQYGRLCVDAAQHSVQLSGHSVSLTGREFALLQALLERPGALRSRVQLEERLYGGQEEIESNVVEVLIHALRRKLDPALIENVRGVGWRLRELS